MEKRRLIFFLIVVLIFAGFFLLVMPFFPVVIGLFDGYDCQWMEGKTLGEVSERYGIPEFQRFDGTAAMKNVGCGYYVFGDSFQLLMETEGSVNEPDSVVSSARVVRYDDFDLAFGYVNYPYDWSRYGDLLVGKTSTEIFALAGVPHFAGSNPNSIVYKIDMGGYFVAIFDGDPNTGDPKMISFEYVPESSDSWIPWEE